MVTLAPCCTDGLFTTGSSGRLYRRRRDGASRASRAVTCSALLFVRASSALFPFVLRQPWRILCCTAYLCIHPLGQCSRAILANTNPGAISCYKRQPLQLSGSPCPRRCGGCKGPRIAGFQLASFDDVHWCMSGRGRSERCRRMGHPSWAPVCAGLSSPHAETTAPFAHVTNLQGRDFVNVF